MHGPRRTEGIKRVREGEEVKNEEEVEEGVEEGGAEGEPVEWRSKCMLIGDDGGKWWWGGLCVRHCSGYQISRCKG